MVFSHFPTDRFYMNRISIRMLITQHCKYMLLACLFFLVDPWRSGIMCFSSYCFDINGMSKISFLNVFLKNFDFDLIFTVTTIIVGTCYCSSKNFNLTCSCIFFPLVLLFGQDARSSKSNFIGCFDPTCHVASVVEGVDYYLFLIILIVISL